MELKKSPSRLSRFVPARLQIARQARRLRQGELATLVGKSPGSISKWESADYDHAPDDNDIEKLSANLDVSPSWFFINYEEHKHASFFRSMRSELTQARDKVHARLIFFEELCRALKQNVELPEVDFPNFGPGPVFSEIRSQDIENQASIVREFWGIGDDPIEHALLLIENAGVFVGEEIFDSAKLDGISRWTNDGHPMMLLARDKGVAVRRRFDAAHELGHLVMHGNVSQSELDENLRLIEEQAMAFAGAFLLPAGAFTEDVCDDPSLDRLADVKLKWKVSIGAMIKRMSSLELISPEYERNLWKHYSYRGWRGFEPYDDLIQIERPENISTALTLLAGEAVADLSEVMSSCGLARKDVAELSGIAVDELTVLDRDRPKILLRSISGEGNVIQFPTRNRKN